MWQDLKIESLLSRGFRTLGGFGERRRQQGISMLTEPINIELFEFYPTMSMSKAKKRKRGRSAGGSARAEARGGTILTDRRCCLRVPPLLPLWALKQRIKLLFVGVGSQEYTNYCQALVGATIIDRPRGSSGEYTTFEVTSYDPNLGVHSVLAVERESSLSSESIPCATLSSSSLSSSKVKSPSSSRSSTNTLEMLLHVRDYFVVKKAGEARGSSLPPHSSCESPVPGSKDEQSSTLSTSALSPAFLKSLLWQRVACPFYNGEKLSKKRFPGTITALKNMVDSKPKVVTVKFDDGDTCDVGVEHIQELPILEHSQIPPGTRVEVRLEQNSWYPAKVNRIEGLSPGLAEIKFDDSQVDIVALESVRLRSSRSSGRHPRGSRIRFRPKQSNSVSDSQDEAQENTSGSTGCSFNYERC